MYLDLLRDHLKTPFIGAFAYGSGVFAQGKPLLDTSSNSKMIDYLVVVRDNELVSWHLDNYRINPRDYPIIGRIALERTNLFNDAVYYVPDVIVRIYSSGNKRIKYGVVGWDVLRQDLYNWNSLFLAGRLHKPTITDMCESDGIINSAMESNLNSALGVALLQLSNRNDFDFNDVLYKIVGISYTNDPRLLLAESPRKIENILIGQKKELEAMYIEKYEHMVSKCASSLKDPAVKIKLLRDLPHTLKSELNTAAATDDLWRIALSNDTPRLVTEAVGRIVRRSAWKQMALGTISTPVFKAAKYAISKMSKRFRG